MKTKKNLCTFLTAVFVVGTLTVNAQEKIYVHKKNQTAIEYIIAQIDSFSIKKKELPEKIYVHKKDRTAIAYNFDTFEKISFSAGNINLTPRTRVNTPTKIYVHKKDGTAIAYNLDNFGKIKFETPFSGTCLQVDPLQKIFDRNVNYPENTDPAAVAKGETATFQFVLQSEYPITNLKIAATPLINGGQSIPAAKKAFVRYSKINNPEYTPVYPEYPDCLWDEESIDVPAGKNQPVWVEYRIPKDAATGDYTAQLVFSGTANDKTFSVAQKVNAKVYPVVLPEQTLWVVNWHNDYTGKGFAKLNGGVEPWWYSEVWWDIYKNMANMMRDHGQNAYLFWEPPQMVIENGTWTSYKFDNYDLVVELFIREGGLKRFGMSPFAGWDGTKNKYTFAGGLTIDDPEGQEWVRKRITFMYNHLKSKGWEDMFWFQIADEPNYWTSGMNTSWSAIAKFMKSVNSEIKIMDAVLTSGLEDIDTWVPQLNFCEQFFTFYKQQQNLGKELWFYTCHMPRGTYANRFIETPALRTRYLHWVGYRYGTTGFLHWGFNWWSDDFSIDHVQNGILGGAVLVAGDEFVVYPGYRKLYSSIRFAAERDGIADYELLKALEKKNPSKASALANSMIRGWNNYDENIINFRTARKELLEALSE